MMIYISNMRVFYIAITVLIFYNAKHVAQEVKNINSHNVFYYAYKENKLWYASFLLAFNAIQSTYFIDFNNYVSYFNFVGCD